MPDLEKRLAEHLKSSHATRYELRGGGMSRMFVADDVALQRQVAIEVLTPLRLRELLAGAVVRRARAVLDNGYRMISPDDRNESIMDGPADRGGARHVFRREGKPLIVMVR